MPTYVALWNYSDQSVQDVKAVTAKAETAKMIESMGGKFIAGYQLAGPYDGVVIAEFSDDEACAAAALASCGRLGIRTITMRAFDHEQFHRILDMLP